MTTIIDDSEKAPAVDAERTPRRQVVAVFAPKGGSGTTVVATNLAAVLHGLGQRVCLVDLDLEFGDVGVALRLDPVRSIADAIDASPRADVVADLLTEYRAGFDCLLAPIDPETADEIAPSLVARLLEQLRPRYDFVVVDTQVRFSDHVMAAVDASDRLLVVATPEITSLKSVRVSLDVLDLLDHPRQSRDLVLQKAGMPSGMTTEEIAIALDLEVAATVPWDETVTASVNDGEPVAITEAGHPVSSAIHSYAVRALIPDAADATTAGKRRGRLFGRKS